MAPEKMKNDFFHKGGRGLFLIFLCWPTKGPSNIVRDARIALHWDIWPQWANLPSRVRAPDAANKGRAEVDPTHHISFLYCGHICNNPKKHIDLPKVE